MGAVGEGFSVGVHSCIFIGFCRFTRVVSCVNNISVSISGRRQRIVGRRCYPCLQRVNVSYPSVAIANLRRLGNKRTLTCSHGHCANGSVTHNGQRGRILRTVFMRTGGIPLSGCPALINGILSIYRAGLAGQRLLDVTG